MQTTRGDIRDLHTLEEIAQRNVQQNVVDVVVLAFSSSRSDTIQRRKWRRLREMHTYGTSTSPPSSVQQVGWRVRLDLQHDSVVQRWRVSAAGLRLRAVGRERGRAAVWRLGFEEVWGRVCP